MNLMKGGLAIDLRANWKSFSAADVCETMLTFSAAEDATEAHHPAGRNLLTSFSQLFSFTHVDVL